jgi:hypothetical protein
VSRFRREVLSIGVSGSEIALARRVDAAGAIEWTAAARTAPSAGSESVAAALAQDVSAAVATFGSNPGNARVTVACDLMRWWTIDLLPGMSNITDLNQYAALRFEEIFREPSAKWIVRADWAQPGPVLCAALPSAVAQAFDLLSGQPWRHIDIVPSVTRLQALALARKNLRSVPWLLACALCDRVTLLWHLGKRAKRIASVRVPAADPWPLALAEIARHVSSATGDVQSNKVVWAVGGVDGPVPEDAASVMQWLPQIRVEPTSGAELAAVLGCTK